MKLNFCAAAGLTLALVTGGAVQAQGAIDRLQTDQKLTGRASPDYYASIHAHSGYNEAPGGSNFRTVIPGLLYRGGSGGMTGLNSTQLQLFCEEGFSNVTFGYTGGDFGPVSCAHNSYVYEFANPNSLDGAIQFLSRVAAAYKNNKGPVYAHCWGGHHESGQMAAYALELFCGFSAEQANAYWDRNSNGDAAIGANVHKRINWFGLQVKSEPRLKALAAGVDISNLCPQPLL